MIEILSSCKMDTDCQAFNRDDVATLSKADLEGSVSLVGPNGCGKTTLLEAVFGLRSIQSVRQTDALAILKSVVPENRKELGACFQHQRFPSRLKVKDIVRFHKDTYQHQSKDVFDLFFIPDLEERRYGMLSGGEQKRINLFFALAHTPQVVFLDEPEAELDAVFQTKLLSHLRLRSGEGKLNLLTSHSPEVISATDLCCCFAGKDLTVWPSLATAITSYVGESVLISEQDANTMWHHLSSAGVSLDQVTELSTISGAHIYGFHDSITDVEHKLTTLRGSSLARIGALRPSRFSDLILALTQRQKETT